MSDFLASIVTSPDPSGTLVPAGQVPAAPRTDGTSPWYGVGLENHTPYPYPLDLYPPYPHSEPQPVLFLRSMYIMLLTGFQYIFKNN
jgi:hypothetical protein